MLKTEVIRYAKETGKRGGRKVTDHEQPQTPTERHGDGEGPIGSWEIHHRGDVERGDEGGRGGSRCRLHSGSKVL